MKNKYLLIITLLFFTFSANAQKGKEDQLKSLKIGYITETLDLSSKEAQQFWPIYNEHQNKIHNLRRNEQRKLMEQIKGEGGLDKITETEAEVILEKFIVIENKIQQEQMDMYSKLKGVISAKKILKLHHAENEFNRKILQRLRRDQAEKRKKP